jgi:hypothetical protein
MGGGIWAVRWFRAFVVVVVLLLFVSTDLLLLLFGW